MAPVKKQQFLLNYQNARTQAMKLTNCQAGFAAAGIWPFDPSKGLLSRYIPQSTISIDIPRPITPPMPLAPQITVVTPYNRQLLAQAIQTVTSDATVDRTVRFFFHKVRKAIDTHSVELASSQRKITRLTSKLEASAKKHKRKQPVNPNSTFITLDDIQRNAVGPPVPRRAVVTPPDVIGTRIAPIEIDIKPLDPFQGVTSRLSSIRFG